MNNKKQNSNNNNNNNNNIFYTIGYSKKELDTFINILKTNGINTLIDVRKNPHSQYRLDFNKFRLQEALDKSNIKYWHVPELGVPSEKRKELDSKNPETYKKLWKWYHENVIRDNSGNLENLMILLDTVVDHPVAFMCLELDPTTCHRHCIAEVLEKTRGMKRIDL